MILDACVPIVRVGGLLAYITCTFSPKENEENIAWFIKRNPDFTPLSIPGYAHLLSTFSSFPSYRIWPYQGLGRGGYVCILQKGGDISPFDASPFDVSIVPPKSIYRID
jgi:16S rRNA C967 or C1407 C5-methylase (RsmB/RsmF family)